MKSKFKKITPDLMVKDVTEAVQFYTEKLGFDLMMLVPEDEKIVETNVTEGKRYVYAMVKRDEVFVMFMRKDVYEVDLPALKNVPLGASATLYLDVDNVAQLYDQYEKEGVEIVKGLSDTWYGMKEFYIKDCNGYILGFAEKDY